MWVSSEALSPPPSLAHVPHTGGNKKTHLSVALSMSPLCAALFQGIWSVFSLSEINSRTNCAAASDCSSSRAELQDRGDKDNQTAHCQICIFDLLVGTFLWYRTFLLHLESGKLQLRCNIDVTYLHLVGNVPEDLSKFSVYSAEPDLSWQWPQSAYRYTGLDRSVPLISHSLLAQ